MNAVPLRRLGKTELQVPVVAFGAGPVSGLMTGDDHALQLAVVQCALQNGINWFDTAAGYGQGASESNLGRCLSTFPNAYMVHVSTKVRVLFTDPRTLRQQIFEGIQESLDRLKRKSVTLIQIHNGITKQRYNEPFSVAAEDVAGASELTQALIELKKRQLARFIGLTGTGCSTSLRTVIRSGVFDTIQIPYNLLNPSAGQEMDEDSVDRNYGNVLADCLKMDMGVFAIRIFAGGALLGRSASAHTLKTPFFPLELYRQDVIKSDSLRQAYGVNNLTQKAIQFTLQHPAVHSAIIGFGASQEIDAAINATADLT
ncbi:MAG TPA: aldo/keto reductase [Pirellula sp.]|nr:aldo/keto reductase [Pirellula sp.]